MGKAHVRSQAKRTFRFGGDSCERSERYVGATYSSNFATSKRARDAVIGSRSRFSINKLSVEFAQIVDNLAVIWQRARLHEGDFAAQLGGVPDRLRDRTL